MRKKMNEFKKYIASEYLLDQLIECDDIDIRKEIVNDIKKKEFKNREWLE